MATGRYRLERPGERPGSIGRVRAYQGSVGVLVRAYAYIRTHGGTGLRQVSDDAVLAANYLRHRVSDAWEMPYPGPCKHEFVASGSRLRQETGVRTLDVAKRLIDHGFHPPTIYFPLIVEECLLIEPTETETLDDIDAFAEALLAVAREAHEQPRADPRGTPHDTRSTAGRGDRGAPAGAALAAHDRSRDALSPVTATTMARRWRAGLLCLLPALVAGCLTMDEPDPTPTLPPATPSVASPSPAATAPPPSEAPRDEGELVIAVQELPDRLLPPANDMADTIALDLVHRTLYRLDEELRPVPDLASDQPTASKDGLTWTIDLDLEGARFWSGRPVTAQDVADSLNLARSPVCLMDRDVCGTTFAHLDSAEASEDGTKVTLRLPAPYSPLLAEVLARLPILDMTAIDETAAGIVSRAGELGPAAPDRLVTAVYEAVRADECITETPPDGCRLADHQAELEAMLIGAGVALPRLAPFTDPTGQVDRAAYANALLDRVAALGQVLTGTGRDRRAAALGLLDGFSACVRRRPLPGRLGGSPARGCS